MPARANGVYSFQNLSVALNDPSGIDMAVSGFAPEGVTVAMDNDKAGFQVGADGSGMHILYASSSGKMTLRLLKTSAANAAMNKLYQYTTGSAATYGSITMSVQDSVSKDKAIGYGGGVVKHTNLGYGQDGPANEWVLQFTQIEITLGSGAVRNLVVNG